MDSELKKNKAILRGFMAANYTDAKLVELLTHARAGKLTFISCCCFIGIVTVKGELHDRDLFENPIHYEAARQLPGAIAAEKAFRQLALRITELTDSTDGMRRRILIPMVKAEIRRRMSLEKQSEIASPESVEQGVTG